MSGTNNANICVKPADLCENTSQKYVDPNVNEHPIIPPQSQLIVGDNRLVTPTRASICTVTDNMQLAAKPTHVSR